MFTGFAVVWLMPLAWLVRNHQQGSFLWLTLAVVPLLFASVRMRAGHPLESGAIA
jgi:hypothetical protein